LESFCRKFHGQISRRPRQRLTFSSALTTNQGVPVGDNQNSLKAGLRGPTLLEDFILREKITHFDHERIPERIVHARGSAAHGVLRGLRSRWPSSPAPHLFSEAGKQTPVFVRFSTVRVNAAPPTRRATCAASP
jgi:catalase